MSGRKATRRRPCAERVNGCGESAFYEFSTQREASEYDLRHAETPWRCVRHSMPDEVLVLGVNRTVTVTAERSKRYPNLTGLFWRADGHENVGSSLMSGPGFRAFADDFPEGTRVTFDITVTAPTTQPRTPAGSTEETPS